jgi:hypothetical protein
MSIRDSTLHASMDRGGGGNLCTSSSCDTQDDDGIFELVLKLGMAYSTVDAIPSKTNKRDVS